MRMEYNVGRVSLEELGEFYRFLGKGNLKIDYKKFDRRYGESVRDENGIPIPFGVKAANLSEQLADKYETCYDQAKAIYKEKGLNPFPLVLGDSGSPVSVNFCAVMATAYVGQLLDADDVAPYGVLVD